MKRTIALLLILALSALMVQPVLAEEDPGTQDAGFWQRIAQWVSGAVEDVKGAASAVGEWTKEKWAAVKEETAKLASQLTGSARAVLQWLLANWEYMTSNSTLLRWLRSVWSNLSEILRKLPEQLPERINQLLLMKRTYEGAMELLEFLLSL